MQSSDKVQTRQHCLVLSLIGNLKPISHYTRNKIFKLDTRFSFIYRLSIIIKTRLTRRLLFFLKRIIERTEKNLLWWTSEQRYPQVSLSSRSEGNVSNSIVRGNEATNARPTFSPCILRINCNHFFSRNFHRPGGQYLFRLHPTS